MEFEFSTKSAGKLVFIDPDTGAELTMKGSRPKVQGDIVVKGTFDSWTVSFDGEMSFSITSMNMNAAKLSHSSTSDFINTMFETVFRHDNVLVNHPLSSTATGTFLGNGNDLMYAGDAEDSIFGGRGNDRLFGEGGNDKLYGQSGYDRLIGGAGSDTFYFMPGYGKDSVSDFDAIGGEGNQDFVGATYSEVKVRSHGRDTVIDLGGGDRLTLLHVRAEDIDANDFTG